MIKVDYELLRKHLDDGRMVGNEYCHIQRVDAFMRMYPAGLIWSGRDDTGDLDWDLRTFNPEAYVECCPKAPDGYHVVTLDEIALKIDSGEIEM